MHRLLRSCRTLLLLLLAPVALQAQQQPIRFAGIPWGAKRDLIADSLKVAGLKLQDRDSDGDYPITGRLGGFRVRGFALMTPDGGVQRITIDIVTPDEKAREYYAELKEALTKKYGKPKDDVARYEAPFSAGDGREDEAIKAGKAAIGSYWDCQKQKSCLALEIGEELTVSVAYEGPGWDKEHARRRKPDTRVF